MVVRHLMKCTFLSRIEKFDLIEYLTWKAKKEDSKKSVCPFANLWQNKNKGNGNRIGFNLHDT
jgi:hypothetical protein